MTIHAKYKKFPPLKWLIVFLRSLRRKQSVTRTMHEFYEFIIDWRQYKRLPINSSFSLKTSDLYPRLFDKASTTSIDPVYFYQNAWCAKKIFENKPSTHVDVGSDVKLIGVLSQYTSTTMVDIRPLQVTLPGLSFVSGSILALPFKDQSIKSLSSICVIEHIGLGRYGDQLDPFGSEKAAKELGRVLAKDGLLYISAPIDTANIVYFNAHRAFTRNYILELFSQLTLVEEKYIYGDKMFGAYDPKKGFGTGLYWFKK